MAAGARRTILGVIADDFTGASDVASMLVRAGMHTVQVIGVPAGPAPVADAIVVALKSRTIPATDAVTQSLTALRWLQAAGARQFYFKYCSTFDSTPAGNIGPVAEALLDALNSDFTIACPAFPENGRTVFCGHLFVGDQLLSDSGMRHHPLTPMTESNLVKVLQAQSNGQVGLLRHDTIAKGKDAALKQIEELRAQSVRLAIADATNDDDLRTLAEACADVPLITGGSGLAIGLPAVYRQRGLLPADTDATDLPSVGGFAAVLSGSCSVATNAQVGHWLDAGGAAMRLDPLELASGRISTDDLLAWAVPRLPQGPLLVYATADTQELSAVQAALGASRAGELVERCLAQLACGLISAGVRRLVVAGGETSGAVVQALKVSRLRIGASIDPGVPWTHAIDRPLLLALKSGNFGGLDFFTKALQQAS